MCCYSTHSHTGDSPRLRWVIPTDRPMTPDEYPAVARRVAQWLDIETMDPTTYEVARLMYWPTCSSDGEYEFREQDGPVLRVDDVLRTAFAQLDRIRVQMQAIEAQMSDHTPQELLSRYDELMNR